MGFFDKLKQGLTKTKDSINEKINDVFSNFRKVDEELLEELEEILIMSDIGVATSTEICDRMRAKIKETGETDPNNIKSAMKEIIADILPLFKAVKYPEAKIFNPQSRMLMASILNPEIIRDANAVSLDANIMVIGLSNTSASKNITTDAAMITLIAMAKILLIFSLFPAP